MKITKTEKILVVVIAALLIATVSAAYWVYSNTEQVDIPVQSISLSSSNAGLEVTLTAQGLNDGAMVQFGTTTSASQAIDGTFTFIGSATANSSGIATFNWMAPSTGTYYFTARAYNTDLP